MTYKKKDLEDLKKQLKSDPNFKARSRRPTRRTVKKEFKKNYESKKTIIKWNYQVNDIVECRHFNNQIGLIVSDTTYFERKVEANAFFVLVGCKVFKISGQNLRKI